MLLGLMKYAGWTYLPNFATRQLLSIIHSIYPRLFGSPPPKPGTPAYQRDVRITYLAVVIGYLLYTFYDAATTVEPNYYQMLGVEPTADENTLKMAFRQFARKHHPDRVGPQGERVFIQVRDAYEALKSPVKRFAYDRFGPDALGWSQCSTLREYIRHGLMQASGFYITSTCILLLLSASGRTGPVAYWRYILLALISVYEMLFILDPSPSPGSASKLSSVLFADPASTAHTSFFTLFWPRRVAYQHIRFLHSLFVLCSFALSNVAPVLFPQPSREMEEKILLSQAQQILQLSNQISAEANAQVQTLYHSAHGPRTGTPAQDTTFPFLGELPNGGRPADEVVTLLARELENLILETQLRADGGPLKSAVDNAVERERKRRAGVRPGPEGWIQRSVSRMNGYVNGYGLAAGAAASAERSYDSSPVRGERTVPGYVRGRSRSLG
ncbi:DnaJ-domain-containing protein [Dichomitus squalens]|uniref:DnaJ-domain-containing protein n=1 Tax=Dichomitus squalens TaxID=114155 RepID=A0A4Q9MKC9_9APHY|nr:DnaJ-domain-containing protein [Dichomitus squalens]